jgi:hypothetical protein
MRCFYLVLMATLLASQVAQAQTPTQTPGQQTPEQKRRAVRAACKSDVEQLCPGKRGEEARQCLQSNEQKLSSECKSAMSNARPPKG